MRIWPPSGGRRIAQLFSSPVLHTRLQQLPTDALVAAAVRGWRGARNDLLKDTAQLAVARREGVSVNAAANNAYFQRQGEYIRRGSHDPDLLAVPEFRTLLSRA